MLSGAGILLGVLFAAVSAMLLLYGLYDFIYG